jgi:hypothetical protein
MKIVISVVLSVISCLKPPTDRSARKMLWLLVLFLGRPSYAVLRFANMGMSLVVLVALAPAMHAGWLRAVQNWPYDAS